MSYSVKYVFKSVSILISVSVYRIGKRGLKVPKEQKQRNIGWNEKDNGKFPWQKAHQRLGLFQWLFEMKLESQLSISIYLFLSISFYLFYLFLSFSISFLLFLSLSTSFYLFLALSAFFYLIPSVFSLNLSLCLSLSLYEDG